MLTFLFVLMDVILQPYGLAADNVYVVPLALCVVVGDAFDADAGENSFSSQMVHCHPSCLDVHLHRVDNGRGSSVGQQRCLFENVGAQRRRYGDAAHSVRQGAARPG